MTAEPKQLDETQAALLEVSADLLDVLIRLHDREVDQEIIDGLRGSHVANWFSGFLPESDGKEAARSLSTALEGLPSPMTESGLDDLAAEFADLYLTHGYRVSPSGSVWLNEDHLERQLPMFEVREWYEHYDISVPDWRVRADDHLVHELQFVSYLCRIGTMVTASDAARFMDQHVLSWVPEFCTQARPRLRLAFYRASFDLTLATLQTVRDNLETMTGIEREVRLAEPATANRALEADTAYVPGVSESW